MIHISNDFKIVAGETKNVIVAPLSVTWADCAAINLVVEEGQGNNICVNEIDAVIESLEEAKIKINAEDSKKPGHKSQGGFGLRQQGHLPYIGRMLAEKKSWRWIAATIGWSPETLKRCWLEEMDEI